jgi:methylthioribose-1-phosphate isomerase
MESYSGIQPVIWRENELYLLDQRKLPHEEVELRIPDVRAAADAITDMVVRGAPAIGITAAYGVVLAVRDRVGADPGNWVGLLDADLGMLSGARPTAVNLGWAIKRMRSALTRLPQGADPVATAIAEAKAIHAEDIAANITMGSLGAELLAPGSSVLTHCNAGALATGGYGTALGVIRAGHGSGKIDHVFAGETRPWWQGSRLTAWELVQEGIPVSILADSAAAHLMSSRNIDWVIVGSDRIAANGDVANKIGTYSIAVLARHHGVKFMVAAPTSTIDRKAATGSDIPIEDRSEDEILYGAGSRIAAEGAGAINPVFDITPACLVDCIVTEAGVVHQPDGAKVAALFT